MNPGIALIVGLFVGWLIELLIDIFYWRKRRLCPDDEALNLRASLEQSQSENRTLQISLDETKTQLGQLETELSMRDARITGLTADLDVRKEEIDGLNGRITAFTSNLDICTGEIDTLNGRIHQLEAALAARDNELEIIRTELGGIDVEAKALGFGSIFAGGGLALGTFWNNLKNRLTGDSEMETRGAELNATLAAKDSEIDGLRLQVGDLEQKLAVCSASLVEIRTNLGADFKGAQGLSMVWGINTAASDTLANRGIYTYNQLAATRADEVSDAIDLASRYYPEMDNAAIHSSWVEQSRLAGSGDWDGLFAYQQQRFNLVSLRDDLKKIWGIGPKVEQVMNDNGIYLFSQMASVPPDRITEILRRAGSRFSMSTGKLHDTWPELARLADKGDWDAFQALQDTLDWSKVQGE